MAWGALWDIHQAMVIVRRWESLNGSCSQGGWDTHLMGSFDWKRVDIIFNSITIIIIIIIIIIHPLPEPCLSLQSPPSDKDAVIYTGGTR
jgi:hypothetical protein